MLAERLVYVEYIFNVQFKRRAMKYATSLNAKQNGELLD